MESALEHFLRPHAARAVTTDTITHQTVFETGRARATDYLRRSAATTLGAEALKWAIANSFRTVGPAPPRLALRAAGRSLRTVASEHPENR